MARGFSSLGVNNGDRVDSAYATHGTSRTYALFAYRVSGGGGGFGRLFEKRASGDTQVELLYHNSNNYFYERAWSTTAGQWRMDAVTLNTWQHVAVTYESGATTNDPVMYLDGVSQAVVETAAPTGTVSTNTSPYSLGNRGANPSRVWDGMLAEFAIWDRVLSATELAALASGFSPLFFPQSLVEYIPLLRDNFSYKQAAPTIAGTLVQPHPGVIYPVGDQVQFHAAVSSDATTVAQRMTAAGLRLPDLVWRKRRPVHITPVSFVDVQVEGLSWAAYYPDVIHFDYAPAPAGEQI
jgi:hypothetical protein